ncbi:MAG: DNA polymerase III subunit delta, partial [Candidatus Krumholzibacteria bacterium]|nr:DNA polymerase III subunit delta [Candidatus Krumholzibacteria bacterium]
YGTEVDMDSFIATANSFPFLSDSRVLILKEVEKLRGNWKRLVEYCRKPVPSSIVVLVFNTHDEAGRRIRPPRDFSKLESAIEAGGRVIRFGRLTGSDVQHWVRQKAKKMGMDMDSDVAQVFVRSVGENLFDIHNELIKLSLLFENKRVTKDNLKEVIGSHRLNAIYDLVESIRPGNEAETLRILAGIINTDAERPSVIVYHLIRHFLSLLKIKAGCRVGGFPYTTLKRRADLFSTSEIIVWLENLRITELLIKSTSFPADFMLVGAIMHSVEGELLEDEAKTFSAA